MAEAKRDNNYVPTTLAVQLDDLVTPIPLVADQSNNRLMVSSIVTSPLPENNASLVLGYTDNKLTTVTKTLDGTSYTKTLSYTGDNLTGVSAWVEV